MKIALSGSRGLVGSRIVELLSDKFEFIHLNRPEFDITKKNDVSKSLENIDFDLFLHLAAYTNVDSAEIDRESAYALNVEGTKNVFEATQKKRKQFIYISTGFVFDGEHPPYFEDSTPNPVGYYGMTKYEGEQIVKDQAMIVRIEYPFRAQFDQKKDFVRAIKTRLESGQEVTGISDSLITPTFIDDIAHGLKGLIRNFSPDIYHVVGEDSLSPYNAALLIAKNWHLDESLIKKITYDEYFVGKARRPKLAEVKSKRNNFYKMKTFKEALRLMNK